MSDPIKGLESFHAEAIPVTPLDPAEVRRRGDRMRRRRNAGAALAGVAAIAVVAVPLALSTGGDTRSQDLGPAGDPSKIVTTDGPARPYVTEIPAGFPLTKGYPATNGNDGSPVTAVPGRRTVTPFELCGTPVWTYDGTVDLLGASYTGEAEDFRARALVLYPSDDAATETLDELTAAVAACPEESTDDGGTVSVYERHDADAGGQDGELVFTQRYRMQGTGFSTGLMAYAVSQVGNALLFSLESNEGGGTDDSVRISLDHLTSQSRDVAEEMCVFAVAGC